MPETPEEARAKRIAAGLALPETAATAANPQARVNTGSHGLEWRDGTLWVVVPPSQTAYQLDPKTFKILKQWKTPGDRPHGIGWEGRYLWVADTNLNMFHKCDPDNGTVVDAIQLTDSDPLPHGMTIWQGHMWFCDDGGQVCRFPLPT
jgi:sugar lactone lactonase YvrE